MPFRKKFPAMKYYLSCSISQLPPPLSCLQCYLCDCNQRLQIRAGFCHPTSSEWDFRYWCSGWDFRCWCSALGFPGIVLQPKILLQDEDWAQVSWEFLLDLFWTEFNLVPQKWKIISLLAMKKVWSEYFMPCSDGCERVETGGVLRDISCCVCGGDPLTSFWW